jgi:hypothetical protein
VTSRCNGLNFAISLIRYNESQVYIQCCLEHHLLPIQGI